MTSSVFPWCASDELRTRVGKRYLVRTYGCQMNEHTTRGDLGLFEVDGMVPAVDATVADVVLHHLLHPGERRQPPLREPGAPQSDQGRASSHADRCRLPGAEGP